MLKDKKLEEMSMPSKLAQHSSAPYRNLKNVGAFLFGGYLDKKNKI